MILLFLPFCTINSKLCGYNCWVAVPISETLENGLTVAVEEQPWNPGVSMVLLVPVGAVNDPHERQGSASMLETWLWKGAGKRDARAFADALDALGVRRSSGAGVEYTTFAASFLPESLARVFELYADLVMRPLLPDEAFESVRALALQELAAVEDQPARKLMRRLRREVFASPHGQPVEGVEEVLRSISAEDVYEEYRRRYGGRGSVLALAGGIRAGEVLAAAREFFASWGGSTPQAVPVKLSPPHSFHEQQQTEQVQIGLFYKDVPPGHYDFYAARLAAEILSGGFSSRLFSEIREKRSLVYSVSATPGSLKGFGYLSAYASTMPERAAETLNALRDEIARLADGVSREELDRAKISTRSDLVLSGESSRARAVAMARDVYILGRPRSLEDVEAEVVDVTLERINLFLRNHPYDRPWTGTLGPVEVV